MYIKHKIDELVRQPILLLAEPFRFVVIGSLFDEAIADSEANLVISVERRGSDVGRMWIAGRNESESPSGELLARSDQVLAGTGTEKR